MTDREKAINVLSNYKGHAFGDKDEKVTVEEIIVLLKAQEPIEARLHLCESCTKEYPECDAAIDGIEFGCGVGNDNIIGCTAYENRWKAQEPRVIAAEELEDWSEPAYLEDIFYGGRWALIADFSANWFTFNVTEPGFLKEEEFHVSEYGRRWRCWTSRPTDEQRKVTPWTQTNGL